MSKKLSDKAIAGLKPKAGRYDVAVDGSGLYIRVTPKGTKTFVRYYWNSEMKKQRKLTLGRYRSKDDIKAGKAADGEKFMTLAQAKKASADVAAQVAEKKDPAADKRATKEAEKAAETVSELADDFIKLYAKTNTRERTWQEYERILNREIKSVWGNKKAKNIQRKDAIALLDKIAARPAPIMANRTHSTLSKMFRWALARDIIAINPVAGIQKLGREVKRERRLEASEIKDFWDSLDAIDAPAVKIALRLLLVTAQRRAEVAGMRVSEIDDTSSTWTIPGSRTKNGLPHAVPLSDLALSLLREAKTTAASSMACEPELVDILFPIKKRDGEIGSMHPDTLTVEMIGHTKTAFKRQLSPHDLRRTVHTLMGSEDLQVPRFIRDKILNHSDRTPGSHYDLHEYLTEKREALTAWGEYLDRLIKRDAGNVVELKR